MNPLKTPFGHFYEIDPGVYIGCADKTTADLVAEDDKKLTFPLYADPHGEIKALQEQVAELTAIRDLLTQDPPVRGSCPDGRDCEVGCRAVCERG